MSELVKIIKRTCDESMTRSKGLLPCDNNCEKCFACVEWLQGGEKQHWSPKQDYEKTK